MKSLSSVCLSVCLSIRPSVTKFSQDCIIAFTVIVHDDSWPGYLVIDEARFLKKKKKLAARNYIFCYFLKLGSLASNDV